MEDEQDIQLEPEVVFEESTEEGLELAASDKIKKLQEKIKSLEKEKTEYLDGWQRARADYANAQKNFEEEKKSLKNLFKENFVEELIPVVDSFLLAFSNKEAWEKIDTNWRKGVEYIYQQLLSVLADNSVTLFGEVGETFDHFKHEAVEDIKTDDESLDHTIAKVLQKGFMYDQKITRAARVSVYKFEK